MVTVIAAFIQAKRVVLAELLAVVFACVCVGGYWGWRAVAGVVAVALLVKSFEWDLTSAEGDVKR